MSHSSQSQPPQSNRATRPTTRRQFLQGAAAAGAGFWLLGRGAWAADAGGPTTGPSDKLNVAFIGVANRAEASMNEEGNAVAGQNVVAICDVEQTYLDKAAARFPKAATYRDFRKLLDRNDIDAVMVSTADHTHAPATLMALESGRHVYCEKPLTHTVEEARRVALTAAKHKRVTQMGTQIHAGDNYRRVVELIRAGAVGKVTEVHLWVGTRWSAGDLPSQSPPVPSTFDYDLWLGPVPPRPYHKEYHPANWRSFWAFGSGTLGDMGCHYMDLPFWALGLTHPTRVSAEGPPVHAEGCPAWVHATWDFPTGGEGSLKSPVTLHWYDGGKKPPKAEEWGVPKKMGAGALFVGEKGMLLADYGSHKLLPEKEFEGFKAPEPSIPKSIGHHREWLAAIRRNDPAGTTCRFDYAGPLAETVLLGTVAYRTGKPIEWDAEKLKVTNAPEAERFIRGEYRKGWGM